MKTIPVILAMAAAVGCAAGPSQEDVDQLRKDHDKFRVDITSKYEWQLHVYNELVAKHGQLVERTAKLEALMAALQTRADRLEDELKNAGARRADLSGPAAPPGKKPEDIVLETQTALLSLRTGKIKWEEAAAQLRPYARDAVALVLEEVRRSFLNLEYSQDLEQVLSRFPPADLRVPLQKALGDPKLKSSVPRIVGRAGDRELSRILEEHAASPDEDFQLAVGEALVACRNAAGVPPLVRSLKSRQSETRTIAISSLKPLNRGGDFSYRSQLSPDLNAPAIKSWEEWADKIGKFVFD